MRIRARVWVVVLALALGVALGAGWGGGSARADVPQEGGTVRLYSGGEVVGEWEAERPGRMDGETFVFVVKDGVRERRVRIRGTFSFEERR